MSLWRIIVCLALVSVILVNSITEVSAQKESNIGVPNIRILKAIFIGLTVDEIDYVRISAQPMRRPLSDGEMKTFVSIINRVEENDISEYKGPAPKGGPISFTVILKTKKRVTLILNGDYFLFSEESANYQVYNPHLGKFGLSLLK